MIGFRVDANEQIATGHLMRCMAIAQMCRQKGEDCLFFLAEEKEIERLKRQGFSYHILHTDWKDMDGELDRFQKLLSQTPLRFLVVDSYQATETYLGALEKMVPVLYLDDMGRKCYPVSAVLHYGIGSESESYRKYYEAQGSQVFMGMSYIPLREEFMVSKENGEGVLNWNQRKNSILITTGGTDPFDVTRKFLEACLQYEGADGVFFKEWEYDVIVGALNNHKEELERLAKQNPQIKLHDNVSNMSEYMRSCKMAISAGGTTLYELCACGIPAVCFSFADNQEPGCKMFGEQGMIDYAGDARKTDVVASGLLALLHLANDLDDYQNRQKQMVQTVDGKGAFRIAEYLTEYSIK